MSNLEVQVKNIAREHGAALVGISSKERLLNAPLSGNPEYLLPSTQSVISFAVTLNKETVRSFLSKKDWLSHCEERKQMTMTLYNISDCIVDFLKGEGFESVTVDGNNVYRPEMGARDFFSLEMSFDTSDSDLFWLSSVQCLRKLYLGWTNVSDAGLEHLKRLKDLRTLDLRAVSGGISDAGVEKLRGLVRLESLNLYKSDVTDAGLEHLKGMKKLERVFLQETQVTDAGIEKLKKTFPNLVVHSSSPNDT